MLSRALRGIFNVQIIIRTLPALFTKGRGGENYTKFGEKLKFSLGNTGPHSVILSFFYKENPGDPRAIFQIPSQKSGQKKKKDLGFWAKTRFFIEKTKVFQGRKHL